jgi:hydroxylamine reductase (hybrid-cluster protein)
MVAMAEVADIIAAAIAGDPPRLPTGPGGAGGIKGASAAAMAQLSELVRRAVTDARREGATLGAGEARQALQKNSSKTEKTAAEAVRSAEERQRAAEEELSAKSRSLAKQLEDTKRDLVGKNTLLNARAKAATNEVGRLLTSCESSYDP